MSRNCLLCGVGGQGVVLASRLIAYAAMEQGDFVRTTETIGMAQRGGSVVSHVRAGEEVHSPLIPAGGADVILAFEPGEAVRCLPYLKEGGLVITNSRIVKPVTASLGGSSYSGGEMLDYLKKKAGQVIVVDGDEICRRAGSAKVLNVALLGAAAKSGALGISMDEMLEAVRKNVKEKYIALNEKALKLGGEQV
ncbi:MAG TPA: indolepyruvate oxidoreductase subunit beta [Candidatus Mediterraneibacter faecigallinarum]|jgi:indolepyruvate ferredoxin oxidoreductase beta subunit|uniref:Indolepyruvate oxidoreductase subunit beta n=1 Tax=Candidatus Mediterraneibacter faecigallinarum TaxID=2838669 RepID=A0A9D2NVD1_9FIRM|nr:indolepyruvate oxidoreductase subunit beta [Candidatus Mediterraneibacter faecigallinarum]